MLDSFKLVITTIALISSTTSFSEKIIQEPCNNEGSAKFLCSVQQRLYLLENGEGNRCDWEIRTDGPFKYLKHQTGFLAATANGKLKFTGQDDNGVLWSFEKIRNDRSEIGKVRNISIEENSYLIGLPSGEAGLGSSNQNSSCWMTVN